MNHDKLLNKLYYEDLNFIGVNPLYTLAKKHDKTISKDFVSNWLKNQSTQQQTTKIALSCNDDKCFIMDNNIDTLTHGHYRIKELQNNISINNNDS